MDDGCESEGSSASDYDADLFEPAEPPPPPLDRVFAPAVQSLTDEALDRFFSDPSSLSLSSSCRQSPYHDDDVPPTTTPATTYACPYYVRDPTAHASCRPRARAGGNGSSGFFPRLLDLRRHLQTAHRRPPWCPACGARFARAAARDTHVRAFACCAAGAPSAAALPPPGLAERQLRRLARRPDPGVPASQQWAALWRLCFGDDEAPPPPAAAAAPEAVAVVARARAFWARHRDALVPDSEPALAAVGRAALEAAVLERMLETLLRDAGGEATTGSHRDPGAA